MKKLLILLFVFLSLFSFSRACFFKQVDYFKIWKARFSANLRSVPCVSSSYILWSTFKWKKYSIIWKTNGWYKIQFVNWKKAWVWDKSIQILDYKLTEKDKTIFKKIYKILNRKPENFIQKLNLQLKQILPKYVNKPRIYTILSEIINYKKQIETPEKQLTTKEIETNQKLIKYNNYIFDIGKVKKTWINWHNQVRNTLKLPNYVENPKLDKTAQLWSKTMEKRNQMNHKRHLNDSYYDYWKIASWMKQNGVICKNIHRATFSESIAYRTFSCYKKDCTDELVKTMRKSFDFYMNEKWKKWDPHYRWIVHPLFKQIWFGISIKKIWNNSFKYFLTTHYCTQVY